MLLFLYDAKADVSCCILLGAGRLMKSLLKADSCTGRLSKSWKLSAHFTTNHSTTSTRDRRCNYHDRDTGETWPIDLTTWLPLGQDMIELHWCHNWILPETIGYITELHQNCKVDRVQCFTSEYDRVLYLSRTPVSDTNLITSVDVNLLSLLHKSLSKCAVFSYYNVTVGVNVTFLIPLFEWNLYLHKYWEFFKTYDLRQPEKNQAMTLS